MTKPEFQDDGNSGWRGGIPRWRGGKRLPELVFRSRSVLSPSLSVSLSLSHCTLPSPPFFLPKRTWRVTKIRGQCAVCHVTFPTLVPIIFGKLKEEERLGGGGGCCFMNAVNGVYFVPFKHMSCVWLEARLTVFSVVFICRVHISVWKGGWTYFPSTNHTFC